MIAIKIKQDIKAGKLVIPELEKYNGNSAEIIILIENEKNSAWPDNFFKETYGFMKSEKISRGPQVEISERVSIK